MAQVGGYRLYGLTTLPTEAAQLASFCSGSTTRTACSAVDMM